MKVFLLFFSVILSEFYEIKSSKNRAKNSFEWVKSLFWLHFCSLPNFLSLFSSTLILPFLSNLLFDWSLTSKNVLSWFIKFSGQYFRIGYRIETLGVPILSNSCCSFEISYSQRRCASVILGKTFCIMHGHREWKSNLKRCL